MAHLEAGAANIAAAAPVAPALAAAGNQPLFNIIELKTVSGNLKANIPLFYGNSSMDNISARFLLDQIRN